MTRAREGIATGIAALLSLTDAVPAAIVVLAGAEIVGFNRASEVLYGYERAAAIGQDFVDLLFDPDDRAGMRARVEAMVGLEAEANWRIRRADGALLVSSFRLVPIDEHHLAWIATDPLDQGLAEQERAVLLSAEHAARARPRPPTAG